MTVNYFFREKKKLYEKERLRIKTKILNFGTKQNKQKK